ncbi:MAG: hypothetical protein QG609_573 [Patescibacteria group bacterium]|nr:hypothetical protein [Patescibacteria group bacterium]
MLYYIIHQKTGQFQAIGVFITKVRNHLKQGEREWKTRLFRREACFGTSLASGRS